MNITIVSFEKYCNQDFFENSPTNKYKVVYKIDCSPEYNVIYTETNRLIRMINKYGLKLAFQFLIKMRQNSYNFRSPWDNEHRIYLIHDIKAMSNLRKKGTHLFMDAPLLP